MKAGRWMLPLAISGVALAALAWWLPPPAKLLAQWEQVPAAVWLGAAGGLLASYALRALRLRDEWARRVAMPWGDALHVTLLHSAAVNLVPLRGGEAGYPWLLHRHWRIAAGEALASLLWLRVQDVLVLSALVAVVFAPVASAPVRATLALSALAALALGGRALASAALRAWPATALRGRRILRTVLQALQRAPARGWLWTGANWLVKVGAAAWLIGHLCGLPAGAAFGAALFAEIGAALPFQAPSGFGVYESGAWAGARLAGGQAGAPEVLGAALVAHVFALAIGLAAALASVWLRGLAGTPLRDEVPR